jgi:hypothetical protein
MLKIDVVDQERRLDQESILVPEKRGVLKVFPKEFLESEVDARSEE